MSLKKRKKSPFWWCRFKVRGKEIFVSTGTTARREAEVFERRLRAALEQEVRAVIEKGYTLEDVARLDIERAQAERVSETVIETAYKVHWRHLHRFFGAESAPSRVQEPDLADYLKWRAKEVKGQTVARELRTLKRGLLLAQSRKWVGHLPTKWPQPRYDAPSEKQAGKFRDKNLLNRWLALLPEAARDEALFAAMTGLRATELKRVRREWIEETPALPVPAILRMPSHATKGRYERIIGLSEAAMGIIRRVQGRGPHRDGTLFGPETRRNAYRRASVKLGVEHTITLRDLRHTHGSNALSLGADIKALMSSMGHKDLAMAARYQHSTLARTATAAVAATQALGLEAEHLRRSTDEEAEITT